ncbi:MAG: branched-chain amino acid ABC transporter permease [Pseudorhodoplanes sp.]|uniref:branched-chain amino acid ABC transporter permease n=1 Tax=Pseudorhodoplanes sp. TaxID=1934341 RepID=UPI003D0E4592
MARYSSGISAAVIALIALSGGWLPQWILPVLTVSLGHGLAVLGMLVLWRSGLVSFGQALYYASGAYAVALVARHFGVRDAFVLLLAGMVAAGVVAGLAGLLLARYRGIFFAMLSLALSMILYGVLANSQALGTSDGMFVPRATFLGFSPRGADYTWALFALVLGLVWLSATAVEYYNTTVAGALATPMIDNELRIEFLGVSVNRFVQLQVLIAGVLTGAGGVIVALSVAHVDPNMAFWTTSGGFVFVAILAGTASVWGAFLGAIAYEGVRTFAVATVPGTWQLILGCALLLTIMFVPQGIGGLIFRHRRALGAKQ